MVPAHWQCRLATREVDWIMARPAAAIPEFDSASPWGRYRLPRWMGARLALSHRLPFFLTPVTRALRKAVKYRLATPMDILVWGLRLRLLPRGNISEEKLYTAPQLFDREEFAVIRQTLKSGAVFVDIGANAGIYSFWAHCCLKGEGRIIAVEPDLEMVRRIEFNVGTNGLRDIELCHTALSDHEGIVALQINPNQRGTNSLAPKEDTGPEARIATEVPLTTLSALMQMKKVTHIDVLKIDIEGHEEVVLSHFFRSAPQPLWPRVVISEFKHTGEDRVVELLAGYGYRRTGTTRLNSISERPRD